MSAASAKVQPPDAQRAAAREHEAGSSPEELLNSLRAVRSAQRRRKKERRRAAKQEEKAQAAAAPQGDEESTQVPATPGQRGDQAKPPSVVAQVETEEQINAVEQNEKGKEEAVAAAAEAVPSSEDHALVPATPAPKEEKAKKDGEEEGCGGGRSSLDRDYHNQDVEKKQPPLKQVRIEDNKEMDGIRSEDAVSRSSQHSLPMSI